MSRCRVLEQCERVCKASFGRRTEADCVSIIACGEEEDTYMSYEEED